MLSIILTIFIYVLIGRFHLLGGFRHIDDKGMDLLTQRNKVLILSDKFGWETAASNGTDPVTSDSEDEKKIKHARKEAKATKHEKPKLKIVEGCSVGVVESRAM